MPDIPEHLELFAHRVRRLIKERGLRSRFVAERIGIPHADLKALLIRRYPPVSLVFALADVLEVSPDYLEDTIPPPHYKVTLRLRKLINADDRTLNKFTGYKLDNELRRFAVTKFTEILDEIDRRHPELDAERAPLREAEARRNLAARYNITERFLEIFLDRSERWRAALAEEVTKLTVPR